MKMKKFAILTIAAALLAPFSASAFAAKNCKMASVEGWGLTEALAKSQAHSILLLSTGNFPVQNDKFSKPKDDCTLTPLGWTCKTTAKICKK
ncbi:MAG: hypothetical protein DHS20C07_15410 [Methyloligella sp.]|nr:MAG: hypothetical protein DHS20C07_15410 [Methyloligella sp.]